MALAGDSPGAVVGHFTGLLSADICELCLNPAAASSKGVFVDRLRHSGVTNSSAPSNAADGSPVVKDPIGGFFTASLNLHPTLQ